MAEDTSRVKIRVFGIGGGGGNAVNTMVESKLQGVEFIAANTDLQVLEHSKADVRLQLGPTVSKGFGAGANPEKGRESAEESIDEIRNCLKGSDMVFITAGLGGGTGTGAAPIVAQVAKEMGILTVAVVTKPFLFEGKRMSLAQQGIEELSVHVDSLIIVPNAKLMEVLGGKTTLPDAFKAANGVLQGAVAGIAEVINVPGMVNVDFADVCTLMSENGMAMMGAASASGENRAQRAAEQAIASPLLEDVDLSGARGVLVNITSSSSITLEEFHEVMNCFQFAAAEATVIVGSVFDENMGDELRVTIVATGLGAIRKPQAKPVLAYEKQVRTGTHDAPLVDFNELEMPAVYRTGRHREAVEAMKQSGVETLDIPSFLRKQAD